MDEQVVIATRRSLHAVAELLLAGPQYREHGTIRLRVTPGGFGQVAGPLRVERAELVSDDDGRVALRGTVTDLAAAWGIEPGAPAGLYHDHADLGPADQLAVDPVAAELLTGWFAVGERALQTLAPDVSPVLWPEHFDLGIQLDEVNYGVSPGDATYPRPYAYVSPWTAREGTFWNAPFGAVHFPEEVLDAETVAAFFARGRAAV